MALFEGTGALILTGAAAVIDDCEFGDDSGVTLASGAQQARRIKGGFLGTITVSGSQCRVTDSNFSTLAWQGAEGLLTSSVISRVCSVTGAKFRCLGNLFSLREGMDITADQAVVEGNVFDRQGNQSTTNTQDGVTINGDRNLVTGNRFIADPGQTRSAVNVASGDCNQIVGNDLGDPADYATDAIIDSGTNTQLVYPADPTYGDNFTGCITSPSSP